ncbi:cyclic nucleotide-binding domain-containing protein [Thiohalocapsa sp.]|uniref:cyclic nucleotide-binding domain-containing protein n=1 Tax=Thiohalocapsa sp. TaxID=2497641 RepID=UPI0025CBBF36|nr:cyclic nucleotide-binding domain-containing protein [Thiohalocapsa sp.]
MPFDSVTLSALVFGLISAATLPAGAAVGIAWRPPDRIMAFLLAFGGGALLAALTIDLIAPGVDRGHFRDLALGAVVGGLAFKLLDWAVNRQGGYLRKPSTALNFWRNQSRRRLRRVLAGIRRVPALRDLSPETLDRLLGVVQLQELPAHTCLYRAEDPPSYIYVVLDGAVELSDPAAGGQVFEHLQRHDAFGRMSFISGLPRATEAHTAADSKLLLIPRTAFMELVSDSPELRAVLRGLLQDAELTQYLHERYGLTDDAINTWREEALQELDTEGDYDPPIEPAQIAEEPVELMRDEPRLGFFPGLSQVTLARIAARLVHKRAPDGYNFFHQGQPADRLYLLRRGTVYLFDQNQRNRRPQVVEAGEGFGGFAFFTEGPHAVTAVAHDEVEVSELRRRDFEQLVAGIPELRARLADYLKRNPVRAYLTEQQHLGARRAAAWMERAAKRVAGGHVVPSLSEMTQQVARHKSAAVAMFLGMTLDGIPESFVIGANVVITGGISLSLLGGLFLANLPEALSSAAGMREQGIRVPRILVMWTSLMLLTGIGSALGALLLADASAELFAFIEGVAAGAMLTMVAETMLPEAFHKGGGVVGLSTLAGFLLAIYSNTI